MAHALTVGPGIGSSEGGAVKSVEGRMEEQAVALERLFPEIHRRLFALEPGQPITEMPLPQLRMFVLLRDGPLPLSTLGELLGISPSTVTQVADRLEKAGLVKRQAGGEDRRVKHLQLTAKGEKILRNRRERRVRRVREVLSRLPEGRRQDVIDALQDLVGACAPNEPHGIYKDPTGERAQS